MWYYEIQVESVTKKSFYGKYHYCLIDTKKGEYKICLKYKVFWQQDNTPFWHFCLHDIYHI